MLRKFSVKKLKRDKMIMQYKTNPQVNEGNLEKILVEELVQKVYCIFNELRTKKDLSPNEHTSALFSSLVELVLTSDPTLDKEVVGKLEQDGTLPSLIDLCCAAEIELERCWADIVINGESNIENFPYFKNYVQLTDYEIKEMKKHINLDGKKMLFVGSGALPLTAIMFKKQQPSLDIKCIDKNEKYVEYADTVLSKLGLNGLYMGHYDISDLDATMQLMLSASDVIFIAALVGNSSQQKNQILGGIHNYIKNGSIVTLRSVPDDMRRLLYPKFNFDDGLKGKYQMLGEYSLPRETGIINSLVILSTNEES